EETRTRRAKPRPRAGSGLSIDAGSSLRGSRLRIRPTGYQSILSLWRIPQSGEGLIIFEGASNGLLKKSDSCFDRLSTNGKSPTTSSLPPFALSLSKGERRVFQHPAKRFPPALGFRFPLPRAGEGQGEGLSRPSLCQRGALTLALSQRERAKTHAKEPTKTT